MTTGIRNVADDPQATRLDALGLGVVLRGLSDRDGGVEGDHGRAPRYR